MKVTHEEASRAVYAMRGQVSGTQVYVQRLIDYIGQQEKVSDQAREYALLLAEAQRLYTHALIEIKAVQAERDRLASWRQEVLIHRKITSPPPGNELHAAVAIAETGYRASQPVDSIAEGAREGMGG